LRAPLPRKQRQARPVRAKAGAAANDDMTTPGVTFHKRMTVGKQALLERSPLSRLVPSTKKRSRDAADGNDSDADPAAAEGGATSKLRKPAAGSEREALREQRRERKRQKKAVRRGDVDGDVVEPGSGVVYLGHIPHGFYEAQMTRFFSQFGEVTRVKLSRSRKTAKSKGYAFLEFSNEQVAKIAAEAMDGYLMLGRALVVKFVPAEELHPKALDGAGRKFRKIPWASVERHRNLQAAKDPAKLAARAEKLAKTRKSKQERLAALGINYQFPELPKVPAPK
jgi:nucleolar protein 15